MNYLFKAFNFLFPWVGKNHEKKMNELNSKFKKPYAERTNAEKIICEGYFFIKMSTMPNMRYYGGIESVLVLEGYITAGEPNFFKEEGYEKCIEKLAEKYLTDRNIL